jgi:glyoxylase-like metal-dependent hydrolase (beta-lactamase superfamily II)
MQEHELRELGIFRIPVPIPFIQAGGPVNAYVVEEEHGLLLFDPGLGTETSQAALAEGFSQIGHRLDEVNRIVLSHGHIDHFGAAAWILNQTGRAIPISIHIADANKVLKSGLDWPTQLAANNRYLMSLGVPSSVLDQMIVGMKRDPELGKRLNEVEPLLDGDIFRCKHVSLEVHHMPGHTPGVCCLYDRDHRLLFSSDHLLEQVSPNPLIELGPEGKTAAFKPLVTYFKSLNRVRSLPVDLVLPGHAVPFRSCLKVIDSLGAFYQRRQAKLLDVLSRGPQTVYDLKNELFPPTTDFELFLMISEILGNLELLEQRGEIVRTMDRELIRFQLAH